MGPRIRVLVVDDSAFARKVVREVLEREPDMEVVGSARDGLDALEKVAQLHPDVVTLDLVMPGLDGVGFLRALPPGGAPPVVVVSMAEQDSDLAVAALAAGAVELVHKPTGLATARLYEMAGELVQKVRVAAQARPRAPRPSAPAPLAAPRPATRGGRPRLVVVGTSTGGPQALTQLLRALPEGFCAPVAIALHIPVGYTEALARRLDEGSVLEVREAADGMALSPGRAVLARAGMHLKVEGRDEACRVALDLQPLEHPHRPAVDVLFESAARAWGADVVGVVLTGMGSDGLAGSRAIRGAGGRVLTEAEGSCVVYGMPRAVEEAGLSDESARLEDMAAALVRHLQAD